MGSKGRENKVQTTEEAVPCPGWWVQLGGLGFENGAGPGNAGCVRVVVSKDASGEVLALFSFGSDTLTLRVSVLLDGFTLKAFGYLYDQQAYRIRQILHPSDPFGLLFCKRAISVSVASGQLVMHPTMIFRAASSSTMPM